MEFNSEEYIESLKREFEGDSRKIGTLLGKVLEGGVLEEIPPEVEERDSIWALRNIIEIMRRKPRSH